MRIEIIVDEEQPLFYPFNKKLLIGADPACDIFIDHPEVSKRHLSVFPDEDRFFVVDLGSRNGTYLNDERMVPGKKTEFTSFFPVRLGKSILLSLVSDEEIETRPLRIEVPVSSDSNITEPRNQEATTVISLKDLNKAKTSTLVKKKTTTAKSRTAPPPEKKKKKKKTSLSMAQVIAFAIIAGAVALHYWLNDEGPTLKPTTAAKPTVIKKRAETLPMEKTPVPVSGDELMAMLPAGGCNTQLEKEFCNILPHLRYLSATETTLDLLVDYPPYEEKARALLNAYLEKSGVKKDYASFSKELTTLATAIYFVEGISKLKIPVSAQGNVSLGFVFKLGEIETLAAIAAFDISLLRSLAVILTPDRISGVKELGLSSIQLPPRFFQVWERERILWASKEKDSTTTTPVPENQGNLIPETSSSVPIP